MQIIYFQKTSELRRAKPELEKRLNININIEGRKATIIGKSFEEYEASIVLDAINFGFSAKKALTLKDENMVFRIINIKNFTRKKNLKDVRARVIGSRGRTKKTIENITNCEIFIKDNEVGLIGNVELIDEITTALSSLIRGTKQANTYRYLEKINKRKKLYKEN